MPDERVKRVADRLRQRRSQRKPADVAAPGSFPPGIPSFSFPPFEQETLSEVSPEVREERFADEITRRERAESGLGTLTEDLRKIGRAPMRTFRDYAIEAAKGQNPIAAGLKLGNIPIEALTIPFAALDRLAREIPGGTAIADVFAAPFHFTAEKVAEAGESLKERLNDPQVKAALARRGFGVPDPATIDPIINEATRLSAGIAQFAVGAGTAMAAKPLVRAGAGKGASVLFEKAVERAERKGTARTLEGQLADAIAAQEARIPQMEQAPLAPEQGIGPTETASLPSSGRTFRSIPGEGIGVDAPLALLPPAAFADIGGFAINIPRSPTSIKPNDAPFLLNDAINSTLRQTGEPSLAYSEIIPATGGIRNPVIVVPDPVSGRTINLDVTRFSTETVKQALAEARKPMVDDALSRGITDLPEYIKLRDEGRLPPVKEGTKPISSLIQETVSGRGTARTPEPPPPPPTPVPPRQARPLADVEGGIFAVGEELRSGSFQYDPAKGGLTQQASARAQSITPAEVRGLVDAIDRWDVLFDEHKITRKTTGEKGRAVEVATLAQTARQGAKEVLDQYVTDRFRDVDNLGGQQNYLYEQVKARIEWLEQGKNPADFPNPINPRGPSAAGGPPPPSAPAAPPPAPAQPKRPPAVTRKIEGEGENVWVNTADVTTRTDIFQTREAPFSEHTAQRIVDDVVGGTFVGRERLPSIHLWQDPNTGELVVISGHSRLEGYRRVVEKGFDEYKGIKAEIHKGTLEEAVKAAQESNISGLETIVERSNRFRDMRASGASETLIAETAKKFYGKGGASAVKLSFLDPDGKALYTLRRFIEMGEADTPSGREVANQSEWLGQTMKANKQKGLNKAHENEIYDFLQRNYKTYGRKFKNEGDFVSWMTDAVDAKMQFGMPEILELDNVGRHKKSVADAEAQFQKDIDDISDIIRSNEAQRRRYESNLRDKGVSPEEIAKKVSEQKFEIERHAYEAQRAELIAKKNQVRGIIERDELDLFSQSDAPPTYGDAVKEATKRLGEEGISPEGTLPSSFGIPPIDPGKVAYIFDPIMKRLRADAESLLTEGKLRDVDLANWIKTKAGRILEESAAFRVMNANEKRKFWRYMQARADALAFDKTTGKLYEKSRAEYDNARAEDRNSADQRIRTGGAEEPLGPKLKYEDGITPLNGNVKGDFSKATWRTMYNYVRNQGAGGHNIMEMMNYVDRRAAQWSASYLIDFKRHGGVLSKSEVQEFIDLADKGGESVNPKVQTMLNWWKTTAKEVIDRAKAAELTTTVAEVRTNLMGEKEIVIVERPIGEREHYFPHEYDFTKLSDVNYRKSMIDGIAKKEGIPYGEAELLWNKYLKHRREVKYGHLEKPRLSGDENWERSLDVIANYIDRTTRRITTAEVMGRKNANAMEQLDNIAKSGGDVQVTKEVFDRWLGRDYIESAWGRALNDIYRQVGSYQVAAKLQLLTLLNPSQVNNTIMFNGLRNTLMSTLDIFKNFDEYREFAKETGAITESTIRMHMKESMSLDGIGGKMLDMTGVTMQERFLRAHASAVTASWMKRRLSDAASNPRLRQDMQNALEIMRLDSQISLDAAIKRGRFTKQELKDIGYEGARVTQFLSRPQDMPTLFSDPQYKLFTQFKTFGAQQADLVWNVVRRDIKNRNPKSLASLGLYFPATGYVVSNVRDYITGKDRQGESDIEAYVRYMATVGSFGLMYDMMNQSSYNFNALTSWVAGPTMSDASKLVYGLTQIPEDKGASLMETGARAIPIPGIQQVAIRLTEQAKQDKSRIRDIEERTFKRKQR